MNCSSMKCPYCKTPGKGRVIDTRTSDDDNAIRRRRKCDNCGERYTTIERFEGTTGSGFAITSTPGKLAKLGFGFEKPALAKGSPGRNGYNRRKEIVPLPSPAPGPVLSEIEGPVQVEQPKPALTREEKRKFIRDLKERMRDAQRAANG
jgi:hypothetical protein